MQIQGLLSILSVSCACVFSHQSCPTLCPHQAPLSMGILQARILEWVAMPSSKNLPNPGIEPRSPTLWADSLPAEPQGKPKNTRVGSLSLLQQIFLTQESNWGLLHCRRILYQLSYQGSPMSVLNNGNSNWVSSLSVFLNTRAQVYGF